MGEHLPCKQGVRSSNLLISTKITKVVKKPSLKKEENHNNLKTNQNFLNKTIKLEINRNVY